MKIVVDTHTLFWYFYPSRNLSKKASSILLEANKIFIPTIVILELFYLLNKLKLDHKYPAIISKIESSNKYTVVSLDLRLVKTVTKLTNKLELHDRIIVATAKLLKLKLITKDPIIKENFEDVIW